MIQIMPLTDPGLGPFGRIAQMLMIYLILTVDQLIYTLNGNWGTRLFRDREATKKGEKRGKQNPINGS
jgi:hypothetical protein